MIVYLHSHDVPDAGRTFGRHSERNVRHITLNEGTEAADVAQIILRSFNPTERERPQGIIELLVFNTHGSPGTLHIGGIEDSHYDVTEGNADELTHPLARFLKPLETGGEGVELHGCYVAGGSLDPATGEVADPEVGCRFIYKLACGFGTRVRASASEQIPDGEGQFEDSLIEAMPSDDDDWHGHVIRNENPLLVREGGFMARVGAMLESWRDSLTPRTHRESPAHPSWDRR